MIMSVGEAGSVEMRLDWRRWGRADDRERGAESGAEREKQEPMP